MKTAQLGSEASNPATLMICLRVNELNMEENILKYAAPVCLKSLAKDCWCLGNVLVEFNGRLIDSKDQDFSFSLIIS